MKKTILLIICMMVTLVTTAQVTASTSTETHWYTIRTQRSANLMADYGGQVKSKSTTVTANALWKFVARTDGSYDIINRATGKSMMSNTTYNTTIRTGDNSNNTGWSIKNSSTGGQYIIYCGSVELNQTTWADGDVVNWGSGTNLSDEGCRVILTEYTSNPVAYALNPTVRGGYQTTGIGNTNALLFAVPVSSPAGDAISLKTATLSITAGADQLSNVKAYLESGNEFYAISNPTAVATATAGSSVTLDMSNSSVSLDATDKYLYITADVSSSATFGTTVTANLTGLTYTNNGTEASATLGGTTTTSTKIFKTQHFVFVPKTNGCRYYRIPAMAVAGNGTIVAATDMRYAGQGDLGNHKIDVAVRTSSDQEGKTWSDPVKIAVGDGSSANKYGYGDAALVKGNDGTLYCLLNAGQKGFWSGMQHVFLSKSTDNGAKWSEPEEITTTTRFKDEVAGTDGVGVFSFFVTSGRGICTKDGTLMFLVDCLKANGSSEQNYLLYSKDQGQNWVLAKTLIYDGANEAKLAQRKDGSLLASVRQGGNRGFNIGTSDGLRWIGQYRNSGLNGNSCNADILKYDDDLMVHSILNNTSSRADLRLYSSINQGETWHEQLTVQSGSTAYSTMDRLSNGDLAILFEDATGPSRNGYAITYVTIPAESVEAWKTNTSSSTKVVACEYSSTGPKGFGTVVKENTAKWTSSNGVSGLVFTTDNAAVKFDQANYYVSKYSFMIKPSAAGATDTYTITAPDGYTLDNYHIQAHCDNASETYTITAGGKSYNVTTTTRPGDVNFTVDCNNAKSATFTIKSNGTTNNNWIGFSYFDFTLNKVTEDAVVAYNTRMSSELNKWMTNGVGSYFGISQTCYDTYNPTYNEYLTNGCTIDEYMDLRDNVMNGIVYPETGYYRLKNCYSYNTSTTDNRWVNYDTSSKTLVGATESNAENAITSVIKLEKQGNGTYYMSVEGQYIQAPSQSTQVALGTSPVAFTPVVGTPGIVSFGTNGGKTFLHCDGSFKIVGWSSHASGSSASGWYLKDAEHALKTVNKVEEGQTKTNYYATGYFPFPCTLSDGAKAYTAKQIDANTLQLTEVSGVPVGEPVVIIYSPTETTDATASLTLTIDKTVTTTASTENILKGTYVPMTWNTDSYLALGRYKDADATYYVPGFYKWSGTTLGANKAYILISDLQTSSNSKGVSFTFDATPTAINGIATETSSSDAPRYNLAGQRVDKSYRGVVIQNGRKMLQK